MHTQLWWWLVARCEVFVTRVYGWLQQKLLKIIITKRVAFINSNFI